MSTAGPQWLQWPIAPMRAVTGTLPTGGGSTDDGPSMDGWVFEPKWDGHRALVHAGRRGVSVISSSGSARDDQWPWIADLAFPINTGDLVVDAEVIGVDDNGRHRFEHVNNREMFTMLVVFDLLVLDGRSIMSEPWSTRRDALEGLGLTGARVMLTPVSDDGESMMAVTKAECFEGVMAKRSDSPYLAGRRSASWRKVKHRRRQEVIVGGYQLGRGGRNGSIGSLLVGVMAEGVLRYVGSVGSGLTVAHADQIAMAIGPLLTERCPFEPNPTVDRRLVHWLQPSLVAEVAFAEWTMAGMMRHPVFIGLRSDKAPADVVRES